MLLAVNYHYIRYSFETLYPAFFGITPELFKKQLEELSRHGNFVSGSEIHEAVSGLKALPERSIVITFDDGLKEQYEEALPILDDLGISAIFFVNTFNLQGKVSEVHKIHLLRSVISPKDFLRHVKDFVRQIDDYSLNLSEATLAGTTHYLYDDAETAALKYLLNFMLPQNVLTSLLDSLFVNFFDENAIAKGLYFSKKQLGNLLERDMIGSHGHEHLPLGTLTNEQKNFQVQKSQDLLSSLGGKKVNAFSYPYGSENACFEMENTLQSNGFTFSFTMKRDVNRLVLDSPFYLSRFDNNDLPGGKKSKIPSGVNIFDFLSNR